MVAASLAVSLWLRRSILSKMTTTRDPRCPAAYPSKLVLLASLSTAASFSVLTINQQPALELNRAESVRLYYAEGDKHDENNQASALTWDHEETALLHAPPMLALMDIEDDWKEWHYSFSRNGFTDYLPQFSAHLSCLIVGGADSGKSSRLPWQEEPKAKITNLLLHGGNGSRRPQYAGKIGLRPAVNEEVEAQGLSMDSTLLSQLVARITAPLAQFDDSGSQQDYDCILDRGLMNAIISSIPPHVSQDGPAAVIELHALMQQASRAIREHGIYVAVTDRLLPEHAKEYLTVIGKAVGMQWKFDLDGISSDEKGISVSVARKYFAGELPSFGHFSTVAEKDVDFISAKHLLEP